jgi:cell division protein FtsB
MQYEQLKTQINTLNTELEYILKQAEIDRNKNQTMIDERANVIFDI